MATPKINLISMHFARRIKDSKTSAGVEFTTGAEDGVTLTAVQRMVFISQALLALQNMFWKGVEGNRAKFAAIFPELVQVRSGITTTSGGQYTIANPNLDFFLLLEALADGKYCEVVPKHLHQAASYGPTQFRATAQVPKVVETGGVISFLPSASFNAKAVILTIITQPLDPTTGGYLTQGGTYDSPYNDRWNEDLVKICTDIFLQDTQRTS